MKVEELYSRTTAVDLSKYYFNREKCEAALKGWLSNTLFNKVPIGWVNGHAHYYRSFHTWDGQSTWTNLRDRIRALTRQIVTENWDPLRNLIGSGISIFSILDLHVKCCASGYGPAIVNKYIDKTEYALRAYENGLWKFTVDSGGIMAFSRPAIITQNKRLHCDDGPAIFWVNEGGKFGKQYYLNNIKVPEYLVETSARDLDVAKILSEKNVEIRREGIRKIGIERVVDYHSTVLDKFGDYELLTTQLFGRWRTYLKMKNPSIGVWHVEAVGPECRTVKEALHWRKPDDMRMIPVSDDGEDWWEQGDVYVWPLGAKSLKPFPSILT